MEVWERKEQREVAYLYYGPTGASILLSHAPAARNQKIPISPHISDLSLRSRVDLNNYFFCPGWINSATWVDARTPAYRLTQIP